MAQVYNPNYSGGRDWEDGNSRAAQNWGESRRGEREGNFFILDQIPESLS
jgi:hypothetical protein